MHAWPRRRLAVRVSVLLSQATPPRARAAPPLRAQSHGQAIANQGNGHGAGEEDRRGDVQQAVGRLHHHALRDRAVDVRLPGVSGRHVQRVAARERELQELADRVQGAQPARVPHPQRLRARRRGRARPYVPAAHAVRAPPPLRTAASSWPRCHRRSAAGAASRSSRASLCRDSCAVGALPLPLPLRRSCCRDGRRLPLRRCRSCCCCWRWRSRPQPAVRPHASAALFFFPAAHRRLCCVDAAPRLASAVAGVRARRSAARAARKSSLRLLHCSRASRFFLSPGPSPSPPLATALTPPRRRPITRAAAATSSTQRAAARTRASTSARRAAPSARYTPWDPTLACTTSICEVQVEAEKLALTTPGP
jgi:hypothetical protein